MAYVILRRARLATVLASLVLVVSGCVSSGARQASRPAGSPSPTSARSPAVVPPTASPAPATIRLRFTGDMLPNDELQAQAARYAGATGYDFTPMLAPVAPLIADADWSICHQETVLSADNSTLAGYPAFSAPFQLAQAEKAAGYDACSTASNHTVDRGAGGALDPRHARPVRPAAQRQRARRRRAGHPADLRRRGGTGRPPVGHLRHQRRPVAGDVLGQSPRRRAHPARRGGAAGARRRHRRGEPALRRAVPARADRLPGARRAAGAGRA